LQTGNISEQYGGDEDTIYFETKGEKRKFMARKALICSKTGQEISLD